MNKSDSIQGSTQEPVIRTLEDAQRYLLSLMDSMRNAMQTGSDMAASVYKAIETITLVLLVLENDGAISAEERDEIRSRFISVLEEGTIEDLRDTFQTLEKCLEALLDNLQEPETEPEEEARQKLLPGKEELAEAALAALPTLKSVRPEKHIVQNPKILNEAFRTDSNDVNPVVLPSRHIKTRLFLTYEGAGLTIRGKNPLTYYKRAVADAVATLYMYGHKDHIITPSLIWRVMTGAPEWAHPTQLALEAVEQAVDDLRFTSASVDCSKEYQARGLEMNTEHVKAGRYESYMINADKIEVQAGGERVTAYRLNKIPVLLLYSSQINNILQAEPKMLTVTDEKGRRVKTTETNLSVLHYLQLRVLQMKNDPGKVNHTIRYDTVMSEVLFWPDTSSRTEKKRLRDYVETVLSYWQREGYISGWERVKSGQQITAVKIILTAPDGLKD